MTARAFIAHITEALARHRSYTSVVVSAIPALISIFYIYTIASLLKVKISILHYFYNHLGFFHLYVVSKNIDHAIIAFALSIWLALSIKRRSVRLILALSYGGITAIGVLIKHDILLDILAVFSVPLILSILVCNEFVPKLTILKKRLDFELFTSYIIATGLVISASGVIVSLIPLFFNITLTPTPVRNYAYEIFVLLSSLFSPLLITLLILCFPLTFFFNRFRDSNNKSKNELQPVSENTSNEAYRNYEISKTRVVSFLSFFMFLSVMMTLVPHDPMINKQNRLLGADIQEYITAIKHLTLSSNNLPELFRHAFIDTQPFHGDRPISLLTFFAIVKIVSPAHLTYVIDYMPIILGPLLILAVYFLTREMTSNQVISILAAFISALSFQVLIGIYAGFYANWFALIVGYFSLVFLFRFLNRCRKLDLVIYAVLTILLLLSHVYTWSMIAIITGIFLLAMLKLNYYNRRNIIFLLLVILFSVATDVTRTSITGSIGGVSSDIQFTPGSTPSDIPYAPQSSLNQFFSFRNNVLDSTQHFLGGLFGNFIILALALYWLFRADYTKPYNIFIMISLSVGIFPLFFSDWVLQTRVFYDIPFQIPAAIALNYILKEKGMKGTMIVVSICVWLIGISIVNVCSFYPVSARHPE